MKPFKVWAKKHAALLVGLAVLYAVFTAAASVEISKAAGSSLSAAYYSGAICKAVFALPPLFFIFAFGFGKDFNITGVKRLILCIPALIIVINNFPILPLINDDMGLKIYTGDILPYLLYCLTVAIAEESVFRGIILPILADKFSKDKKGLFLAVVISSALFGGTHLINLLSGVSASVLLQVGYSFLIGLVFGACMLFTGNLIVPIILHFIFDLGGLLFDAFGYGRVWTAGNIALTAVVAVFSAAILIAEFLKSDFSFFYGRFGINKD